MTTEQNNDQENVNSFMKRIEMNSDKRWEDRDIKNKEEDLFHTNVIERAERLGFKRDMNLDYTANYQLATEYIDSYYRYGAADKEDIQ